MRLLKILHEICPAVNVALGRRLCFLEKGSPQFAGLQASVQMALFVQTGGGCISIWRDMQHIKRTATTKSRREEIDGMLVRRKGFHASHEGVVPIHAFLYVLPERLHRRSSALPSVAKRSIFLQQFDPPPLFLPVAPRSRGPLIKQRK
ncbi:unnamed protein product [Victoria cruziana]